MADLNVTFAGLALKSPVIAECRSSLPSAGMLRDLSTAGAGAVILPPLDAAWLDRVRNDEEITGHNSSDSARRISRRLIRRMNIDEYMNGIEDLLSETEVPVIASIEDVPTGDWLDLAARCRDAGAAAVELRPVQYRRVRSHRADQIEREIIRIAGDVASRLDFPVLPRLQATPYGMQPLVQALGEAGAKAIILSGADFFSSTDLGTPEERAAAEIISVKGTLSLLYRRVNPHLAAVLSGFVEGSLPSVIRTGATLAIVPVDESSRTDAARVIARHLENLRNRMAADGFRTLFDLRGQSSESRRTSSLENNEEI